MNEQEYIDQDDNHLSSTRSATQRRVVVERAIALAKNRSGLWEVTDVYDEAKGGWWYA